MITAPIPPDEEQRYRDLLSYGILDSEEEEDYSALVNLAADICHCEGAAITFIDSERQWFKAAKNIPLPEMPRDISFCGHTILGDEALVINDTTVDERFFDNPLVIGEFKVGFYAGAPIISSAGYKLGTVCVLDHKPKHASLRREQKKALEIIAAQVKRLLELRSQNHLVAVQATRLLEAEKNIARLNTIRAEKLNDVIAYELHENIAQVAAIARMKAESMREGTELNKKGLAELQDYLALILKDVRQLSYKISPTTLKSTEYRVFIEDLAKRTRDSNNIQVEVNYDNGCLSLQDDLGINVYRVIEYFLRYSELSGSKKVNILLKADPSCLELMHDGEKNIENSEDALVLLNNIRTRAEMISSLFEYEKPNKMIRILFSGTGSAS